MAVVGGRGFGQFGAVFRFVDQFSAPSSIAMRSALGLRTGLDQAAERANALAASIGIAGVALTAFGAVVVGTFTRGFEVGVTFEETVRDIAIVSGLAEQEVSNLAEAFVKLSAPLPISAQELANAGTIAARMGIAMDGGAEAIKNVATEAIVLSKAVGIAEQSSANFLARFSKLFELSLTSAENNAAKLASALTFLRNTSTATGEELINMGQRAAGSAEQFGLTAAETLSFMATLRDGAVRVQRGATNFQSALGQIISKSQQMAKFVGLSTDEFIRMRDETPAATLVLIAKKLKALSGDNTVFQKTIQSLFGKSQQMFRMLTALAKGSTTLEQRLMGANTAFDEGTLSAENFNKRLLTLKAQFDVLRGSLANIGIAIFNTFSPIVSLILIPINKIVNSFVQLNPLIKNTILFFTGLAGALILVTGLTLMMAGASIFLTGLLKNFAVTLGITIPRNAGLTAIAYKMLTTVLIRQRRALSTASIAWGKMTVAQQVNAFVTLKLKKAWNVLFLFLKNRMLPLMLKRILPMWLAFKVLSVVIASQLGSTANGFDILTAGINSFKLGLGGATEFSEKFVEKMKKMNIEAFSVDFIQRGQAYSFFLNTVLVPAFKWAGSVIEGTATIIIFSLAAIIDILIPFAIFIVKLISTVSLFGPMFLAVGKLLQLLGAEGLGGALAGLGEAVTITKLEDFTDAFSGFGDAADLVDALGESLKKTNIIANQIDLLAGLANLGKEAGRGAFGGLVLPDDNAIKQRERNLRASRIRELTKLPQADLNTKLDTAKLRNNVSEAALISTAILNKLSILKEVNVKINATTDEGIKLTAEDAFKDLPRQGSLSSGGNALTVVEGDSQSQMGR